MPNIEHSDALDGQTRFKFDAWRSGVGDAFSRDNRKTYQALPSQIERATAFDVVKPLPASIQRRSFLSVRKVFREGVGFKQWPNTESTMLDEAGAL